MSTENNEKLEERVKIIEDRIKFGTIRTIQPTTMRVKEAAKYIGISVCVLRELYAQNKIPCIRPNGKKGIVLFRKESLDKWMEEQEQESVQSPDEIEMCIGHREGRIQKIL